MKRKINGKIYDTAKAKSCGSNKVDNSDEYEELYRKRNGEFFIYGSGGPNSRYAVFLNGEWKSGCAIYPITYKVACDWAKKKLSKEEYNRVFGESLDEKRVSLNIILPAKDNSRLRTLAASNGLNVTEMIRTLINDKWEEVERCKNCSKKSDEN